MGKTLLIISLCVFACVASATHTYDLKPLWQVWKERHQKYYTTTEEALRFAIFNDNHQKIMKWNAENSDVKLAINKFADLTAYEFKTLHADCEHNDYFEDHRHNVVESTIKAGDLPASIDWRNRGAVTAVKDQGNCGSCWSFSTTGVLEGFNFVNSGELLSFAEQQLVDCDKAQNMGCNGGLAYNALTYTGKNGIELEADYPYTAKDGTCSYDKTKTKHVNSDYGRVNPKDSDALKGALVNHPVAVSIQADQSVFQFYSSGVISINCGASLNHAVLAVGYTKVGLLEAFIVKNSWGENWGEQGYVYISTLQALNNGAGACGILTRPIIPVA
jgi:KDEL-tailed cysteine endopeptidase